MPLRRYIVMLLVVLAAAGLSVAVALWLAPGSPSGTGAAAMLAALFAAALLAHRHQGRSPRDD